MTYIEQLHDLLSKIDAATGPDRALDYMIAEALGIPTTEGPFPNLSMVFQNWTYVERWTASIDTALALVERKLPGWWYRQMCYPTGNYTCQVGDMSNGWLPTVKAPTQPLAILGALISALISLEETK